MSKAPSKTVMTKEELGLTDLTDLPQGEDLSLEEEATVQAMSAPGKEIPEPVIDVDLSTPTKTTKRKMFTIVIDEVEGHPNYETVGVNGKVYRIKRGEEVDVPAEVIEVLKNARADKVVQRKDPITGAQITEKRSYSAIPWRKV